MIPYMTTHSAASFGHDTNYDNDFISGLVPNLLISMSPFSTPIKGHNTQHSGHKGQNFSTEKSKEIQLVRTTEVHGKV